MKIGIEHTELKKLCNQIERLERENKRLDSIAVDWEYKYNTKAEILYKNYAINNRQKDALEAMEKEIKDLQQEVKNMNHENRRLLNDYDKVKLDNCHLVNKLNIDE